MGKPGPLTSDRRFAHLLRAHTAPVAAYARATAPDTWTAGRRGAGDPSPRGGSTATPSAATGSFEGWLIRICRHCLIDFAGRSPAQPTDEVPERLPNIPTRSTTSMTCSAGSPSINGRSSRCAGYWGTTTSERPSYSTFRSARSVHDSIADAPVLVEQLVDAGGEMSA